jgi:hypothetical protein
VLDRRGQARLALEAPREPASPASAGEMTLTATVRCSDSWRAR